MLGGSSEVEAMGLRAAEAAFVRRRGATAASEAHGSGRTHGVGARLWSRVTAMSPVKLFGATHVSIA